MIAADDAAHSAIAPPPRRCVRRCVSMLHRQLVVTSPCPTPSSSRRTRDDLSGEGPVVVRPGSDLPSLHGPASGDATMASERAEPYGRRAPAAVRREAETNWRGGGEGGAVDYERRPPGSRRRWLTSRVRPSCGCTIAMGEGRLRGRVRRALIDGSRASSGLARKQSRIREERRQMQPDQKISVGIGT